jgi:hypothetical protein
MTSSRSIVAFLDAIVMASIIILAIIVSLVLNLRIFLFALLGVVLLKIEWSSKGWARR